MTTLNVLILPMLIDVLALAYLALQDYRYMSVSRKGSLLAEASMGAGIILLAVLNWEFALLQVIIGIALFFLIKRQLNQVLADLDKEVIVLVLCSATLQAVFALMVYFAYHILSAYYFSLRKGLRFPALFQYAVIFIPIAFLSFLLYI